MSGQKWPNPFLPWVLTWYMAMSAWRTRVSISSPSRGDRNADAGGEEDLRAVDENGSAMSATSLWSHHAGILDGIETGQQNGGFIAPRRARYPFRAGRTGAGWATFLSSSSPLRWPKVSLASEAVEVHEHHRHLGAAALGLDHGQAEAVAKSARWAGR